MDMELLPLGSYAGVIACSTIVLPGRVIGGSTVSCRCGAGRWYETKAAAEQAVAAHREQPR